MNRYLVLFCLLLCTLKPCAQNSKFHINGKIDSKYNGALITLFTFTGSIIRSVDSTYVENGNFHFEGPEYLYEKSLISIGNYPHTVLYAELLLEKGPIEVILKQKSEVYSPLALEYQHYLDSCSILQARAKIAIDKEELAKVQQDILKYKFEFKKKHIHNGMGRELFLKDSQFINDPHFDELYDMLSIRDKSRGDVSSDYKNRQKRLSQQSLTGKQFIDFTLINSFGEERKISDYIGKQKLLFLDFWASWCGPCRAQEPHLARLYQQYKDKGFEILGISLDENRNSWLSTLKEKLILWPELCVLNPQSSKQLWESYSIAGIPTGILVNKDGTIIYVTKTWQQLDMVLKLLFRNE